MQTCYFAPWECLVIPINNDSITLYEILMPKVFKSTCWKLWCLSTCKKSTSSLTFFGDIVKTLQTCYFGNFGNAWPFPSKIIVSTCRKLSHLFACKISTSSLTSFLWYCKERANLLFWVIWACLAINLNKKNQLHPSRFPWDIAKILQTYFLYFGHAWLRTAKVILSTCRKHSCLSAAKKSTSSPTFSLR